MKKSEIEVGKTYHNGKKRRTERRVVRIIPSFKDSVVYFATVSGMKSDWERFGDNFGQSYLGSFASWAKGIVE